MTELPVIGGHGDGSQHEASSARWLDIPWMAGGAIGVDRYRQDNKSWRFERETMHRELEDWLDERLTVSYREESE